MEFYLIENRKTSSISVVGFLVYKVIANNLKTAKGYLKAGFYSAVIDLRTEKRPNNIIIVGKGV